MISAKLALAVAAAALTLSSAASASTPVVSASNYSVTGDFSATTNPNGAWTYGWLDHLGGVFTQYTVPGSATAGGTIQTWHDPAVYYLGTPSVWNNSSASAFVSGTVNYSAGWAGFHPGPENQMSDFRFTAVSAGTYALAFDFQGADVDGTSTDVHVYSGGGDLFSASIVGYGDATRKSFSGTVFLNAGQTVDIAVGYATNSLWNDSTAVRGTIAAVPEPETYALMIAGLGLLGFAARRRQQGRTPA